MLEKLKSLLDYLTGAEAEAAGFNHGAYCSVKVGKVAVGFSRFFFSWTTKEEAALFITAERTSEALNALREVGPAVLGNLFPRLCVKPSLLSLEGLEQEYFLLKLEVPLAEFTPALIDRFAELADGLGRHYKEVNPVLPKWEWAESEYGEEFISGLLERAAELENFKVALPYRGFREYLIAEGKGGRELFVGARKKLYSGPAALSDLEYEFPSGSLVMASGESIFALLPIRKGSVKAALRLISTARVKPKSEYPILF